MTEDKIKEMYRSLGNGDKWECKPNAICAEECQPRFRRNHQRFRSRSMKKLKYILFGGDPNYDYYEEDIYSMGLIPTIGMMIVALSFILLPMLFTSCTRTVYVDKDTNEVIEVRKVESIDFIKLQRLDYDANYPNIYIDTYTDVLYAVYPHKMTAIMKADGSCMTYTEWKERN